jgi:hypothetical protein
MLTANNQSFLFLTRKGTSHRIFNPRDLYLGLEFDMLQSSFFQLVAWSEWNLED